MKVATFFCHQVGQIWSYRAVIFFLCSKSRDLGLEHGFRACFKKQLEFHNRGVTKTKTKMWDELAQNLVPGALDDTKTIEKVGADIFAKSGPDNSSKKREKTKTNPDCSSLFHHFPVDLA